MSAAVFAQKRFSRHPCRFCSAVPNEPTTANRRHAIADIALHYGWRDETLRLSMQDTRQIG
jgi:hypothetical protein